LEPHPLTIPPQKWYCGLRWVCWVKSTVPESDIVYVAVAPKDNPEAGLVERVASIVKKDLFGTRAILNSKIPRMVGRYSTQEAAEAVAEKLKLLGLVAVVCRQAELHQPSTARFRAHTLQLGEGKVTFWDKGGQERAVEADTLFLILRGTVQTQSEKETTRTKTELNVTATVLTGGIPVIRRVQERTTEQFSKTEDFVRLYGWTSPEPVVEVFQHGFDYSSLEGKKGYSSQENINIIVAELRKTFPAAIFDSRLVKHFAVDVPFATPQDAVEINSKLIYLCSRAAAGRGPTA
jgi:hypothetical protein